MFGGVAFFSYIMSNFIEIIASYTSKISVADKTKELEQFLISMQRFTNNTPLPKQLIESIYLNQQYYQSNDWLASFEENNKNFRLIPTYIKNAIITTHLFSDVFRLFERFFQPNLMKNKKFIAEIARGLMPRLFLSNDPLDNIIYEEG